jgi:hypothetical protein
MVTCVLKSDFSFHLAGTWNANGNCATGRWGASLSSGSEFSATGHHLITKIGMSFDVVMQQKVEHVFMLFSNR